ncbi:MAG: ABC transporter substrate-binding protein, partial [Alphaproteobacteria bacterium]|nr:ABC transporter substrate-binding protein [Alphaproteobacteria bacterium]
IDAGDNLSDLLRDGDLDAMVAYKPPPVFLEGHPGVARLFADYQSVEMDYARRTGIFPIMHLIGVRRDLSQRQPDLIMKICRGFEAARRYSYEQLKKSQALYAMLPWSVAEVKRTEDVLGANFWSYGYGDNQCALEALCRYSFAQGITPRLVKPKELFAESSLAWDGTI